MFEELLNEVHTTLEYIHGRYTKDCEQRDAVKRDNREILMARYFRRIFPPDTDS